MEDYDKKNDQTSKQQIHNLHPRISLQAKSLQAHFDRTTYESHLVENIRSQLENPLPEHHTNTNQITEQLSFDA